MPGQPDETVSSISLEDIPHQPFVELLQFQPSREFSLDDLKAVRAKVEQERDDQLEQTRKQEEDWKKMLAADRHELETLNKLASADTNKTAKRREDLHIEIAALERGLREKA